MLRSYMESQNDMVQEEKSGQTENEIRNVCLTRMENADLRNAVNAEKTIKLTRNGC